MRARIGRLTGLALVMSLAATAAVAGPQSEGGHGAGPEPAGKRQEILLPAAGADAPNPGFPGDLRETLTAAIEERVRLDGAIGAIDMEVVIPD